MSMFKKDEYTHEVETVIGPSVKVEGDFSAQGNVTIEGSLSGKLRTEQHLTVGSEAKIWANVVAGSAAIAGEIQGNIKVQEGLELASTARVFGDVKASVLSIAAGAVLHGKCQIGEEQRSRPEKPGTGAAEAVDTEATEQ